FRSGLSSTFLFTAPATTQIYTLSLHDALPIFRRFEPFAPGARVEAVDGGGVREVKLPDHVYFTCTVRGEPDSRVLLVAARIGLRSEEHTSELQSRSDLVCRLLLEKKKKPQEVP